MKSLFAKMQLASVVLVLTVTAASAAPAPDLVNSHVIGGSNAKSDRLYQVMQILLFCGRSVVTKSKLA